MINLAKKARLASKELRKLTPETRLKVLRKLAETVETNINQIVAANKKDHEHAEKVNLSASLKDRLLLDEKRVRSLAQGVREIAEQDEVVGVSYGEFTNQEGLTIQRQRIPLGVILMIFESRPNVVVDCAALALKSSNAIILKGGKEAKNSNEILGELIQKSIQDFVPKESVQVLASDSREEVHALLSMDKEIDVVIPRGGEKLIEHVYEHAKMPVIAHFKGLCHMYLDKEANLEKAINLVVNAKTQRTGVCNAIESLLIHQDILAKIAQPLTKQLQDRGCEIRADQVFIDQSGVDLKLAKQSDWETEYLENILSIRTVDSLDQAIDHIDQYGSFHTEAIVSEDQNAINIFQRGVDASCIAINASTRFNDGGQLGLGAELGISTTKFHAYGPMGAEQMTTSRYVVVGNGNVRT